MCINGKNSVHVGKIVHMERQPTHACCLSGMHRPNRPRTSMSNVNAPANQTRAHSHANTYFYDGLRKETYYSNDYVVYSVEKECDLSVDKDPLSFKQGMNWDDSEKWYNATKEELKSLDNNKVWI